MSRLLFCLKHRDNPWGDYGGSFLSSGLRNSVTFIVDMLILQGIEAKLVEVIDNNFIDREVRSYQPTHVIIEAFWVVPEKFDVLKRLHPTVTWIVRDHSETPFIANEGMAMRWIAGYLSRGVEVDCNAPRSLADLQVVGAAYGHPNLIGYAPNYYPVHAAGGPRHLTPKPPIADDTVRVGCFGAVRPLKNHLLQAVAALKYAHSLGKKLEFHINGTRIEGSGLPVLHNLRGLFNNARRAVLVEHEWMEHDNFVSLLQTMDICLQVSFSEPFNIVSADAAATTPLVVSSEVPWIGAYGQADPHAAANLCAQMLATHRQDRTWRLTRQWNDLTIYCRNTQTIWWDRFGF